MARLTETERHPASRALVASFLFTDLVGFSKGTAAEQYAAKSTLSAILRSNLATLRDGDYRVKDTGDGALIAFVSSPEHALYMALAIADDFGRAAGEAGFPANSLRTGLHLGSVKESIDVEARPDFIGDGINAAKRIMDFAAPGQITASQAFFDAVGSLDSAYAELFRHVGAPDDKHGRAHELYAISPSNAVLEKLKLDLRATPAASTKSAARSAAAAKPKRPPAPAAAVESQVPSSRTGDVVRKSAIPVIVVIALGVVALFVSTKLTDRNGSKSPQATSETVATPAAPKPVVAQPASPERAAVDAPSAPAAAPPPEPAPPVPAAQGAATPESGQAPPVSASAALKTPAKIKPRSDAPVTATPPDVAPDRNSPRCSRIMEKATLGEALSEQEKRELATSCR